MAVVRRSQHSWTPASSGVDSGDFRANTGVADKTLRGRITFVSEDRVEHPLVLFQAILHCVSVHLLVTLGTDAVDVTAVRENSPEILNHWLNFVTACGPLSYLPKATRWHSLLLFPSAPADRGDICRRRDLDELYVHQLHHLHALSGPRRSR
jgi:hypothetical protein